jgi:cbb3-type cytochrome oxidase maturation protein
MNVLYLVLPLALVFATVAVVAFVWVVRSGQLDDVDTPPHRILFDDDADASTAQSSRRNAVNSRSAR